MSKVYDLLDYEEEENAKQTTMEIIYCEVQQQRAKGPHVSIHTSSFRDFLLKPEILRAMTDCGFEYPSEIQQECIPQAVIGTDILCQAKSGTGKTSSFVIASLQELDPTENVVSVLVMCRTREMAIKIGKDYKRFSKYMPNTRVGIFFGGLPITKDRNTLKSYCPHIVVGTLGRILALVTSKALKLNHLKHFILDECNEMLKPIKLRRAVQEIDRNIPHGKQVMMFSATLIKKIRPVCRKFMICPMEVYEDEEAELTLHELQQNLILRKTENDILSCFMYSLSSTTLEKFEPVLSTDDVKCLWKFQKQSSLRQYQPILLLELNHEKHLKNIFHVNLGILVGRQ